MSDVFCDYFQLSFPSHEGDGLLSRFLSFDGGLTLNQEILEQTNKGVNALYKSLHSTGTIRIRTIGKVVTFGASGGICGELRSNGMLPSFLYNLTTSGTDAIGHVVTRLDATLDLLTNVDGYILRTYEHIKKHGVQLTRKRISGSDFELIQGTSCVDPSHAGTGTIRLPRGHSATVKITIYDKSHQMAKVFKQLIPPTIRFEMGLSREVGLNCKDICNPAPVFWHHMDASLLTKPSDTPLWDNAYKSVYVLPPANDKPIPYPYQRLMNSDIFRVVRKDIEKGFYTIEDATNAFVYLLTKKEKETTNAA